MKGEERNVGGGDWKRERYAYVIAVGLTPCGKMKHAYTKDTCTNTR